MLFNICIRKSWQDVWLLRLAASDECEEYMISKLKVNDQRSSLLSSDHRIIDLFPRANVDTITRRKCNACSKICTSAKRFLINFEISWRMEQVQNVSSDDASANQSSTGGQLSPKNFTLMVLTANYWSLSSCAPFTLPREVSIALLSPPHRPHRREVFDCFSWPLMSTRSQPTTCRSLPAEHSLGFINIRDVSCRLPSTRKNTSVTVRRFLPLSWSRLDELIVWWTRHRCFKLRYSSYSIKHHRGPFEQSSRQPALLKMSCCVWFLAWFRTKLFSVPAIAAGQPLDKLERIRSSRWLRTPPLDNLQKVCCRRLLTSNRQYFSTSLFVGFLSSERA